jgi:hypothetical protein
MRRGESQGGLLRRFGRSVALTIGLAMAGLAGAAGWKAPKVDEPPIEWAKDRDQYDPPAQIAWPDADDPGEPTDGHDTLPLTV